MKFQKTIAATLSAAMLLSVSSFAATPSDFSDFPADWSTDALTHAVENGLLNGSDGKINAKGTLTRAQMAAIVNRAFGAEKAADLTRFVDMLQSAWYYDDMGKAVQMGTFVGSGDKLNPEAPITREQAFAVLARAFALSDGNASSLSKFSDSASVSSWAVGSAAALVEAGYVNGSDGKLNPKGYMTRAEFAQMMDNLVKAYVTSGQTITEVPEGNVVVRASGATLKNITVDGDLVIADGATSVTLDGVTVKGNIILRGGANGVTITGATRANGVTVENPNGTTVLNGDGSKLGTVHVKTDLTVNGTLSNASIDEKATLTVNQGGKVGSVTVNAPGSQVKGSGTVNTVQANASNTTVTTPNTKVTAGTGTSNVKAGDKTVEPGKTETVGTTTNGGGSSSGGGGGSSSSATYQYVLMNIPYADFYATEISNKQNAEQVDAVTSATKQKPANSNLVSGSYHKDDNSEITGVTFPVRVSKSTDLTKLTTVTKADSEDALFAGASYAYYTMSSTPPCYKELTVAEDGTFTLSEVKGTATTISDATATISDSSNYGDYQINLSGDSLSSLGTVYGVVLNTQEGNKYGLRHLENIWRNTSLAFSTGFTTVSHGSPLSADHYKAIMGQKIQSITYYTSTGVKNIAVDLYVPIKFEHTLTVANAVDANTAAVTATGFPKGYMAKYEVLFGGKIVEGASCDGTTVTLPEDANVGVYTLKVTDTSGKYASYSATFEKQTATNPVEYTNDQLSLTAVSGKTDEDVKAYVSAITEVKVGEKTYIPSGRGDNVAKIFNANGGLDLTAAPFADMAANKQYTITVQATGYSTPLTFTVTIPQTIYAYASVPYGDYWQHEDVYLEQGATWDDSSDEADARGEMDKGAFDAVSRATTLHGWHRGSFQQNAVIKTDKGDKYISYWKDEGKTVVLRDGTEATWDSTAKTLTYRNGRSSETATVTDGYQNLGIKYVPVKVSANDFIAFSKKYMVIQNGETLQGGYSENQLTAYSGLIAAVASDTNGLKEVTKSGDSYSFGKRTTGNGSGIKGQTLKTAADTITAAPQAYAKAHSYGAHLRVDLLDGYGDLGSYMQTVVWKYYGTTDPSTSDAEPLTTYGTKFAADDWMHKSMGIQLGLTDSKRFQLPEGKDGTGYWTITVYALGYQDTTYTVNLKEENVKASEDIKMTSEQKTQLESLRDQAKTLLDAAKDSENLTTAESTLKSHYDEIVKLLANSDASKADAQELIDEVPGYIQAVESERANQPTIKTVTGQATVSLFNYTAKVTVNYDTSTGKITEVKDNGTDPGSNSPYWTSAQAMFAKFIDKTKDEVSAMKTDPAGTKTDAVSGATYSSDAIRNAVVNALNAD